MSATQKLLGGRYQIVQVLSAHPAGQTFLAADIHYPGHPRCVVRQLRLPTRNPMTRKFIFSLLRKKVEVLEVIGQHEQVPSTFAAFDFEQSFYVVQEFIPGRSLKEELVSGQPWSQSDALYFLKEVLPVVAFAQERGVVHGNLKPSKLIRHQKDNRLVVLDFGAIKSISQNVFSRDAVFSSHHSPPSSRFYLAPEQFQGQSTFCSDHYALGMLTVQALTGLAAEELPAAQHPNLRQEIVGLLEGIPGLSVNMISLLARMVHPSPDRRYQKATDVLSDIEQIDSQTIADLPITIQPSVPARRMTLSATTPQRSFTRKLPWKVIGVAGIAFLALLAGLVALELPQRFLAKRHMRDAEIAKLNDPDGAINRYTRAIQLFPNNPEALSERSQLQFELGDTEAALADITRAIELVPQHPNYLYDRGNLRFAVGDVQGAIEDYTQSIRHDATFTKAYVNRGSARAAWGDDQGAIEDYTQALELEPSAEVEAAAYLNRCLSYSNVGEQVAALDDCSAAIGLRPSHGLAYQNRGLVKRRLGDFKGSLQDYNIAIKIEPDSSDSYYNRGLTRQAMDDIPGAMEDFSKAIAIDSDYVFAVYDRGLLQADLGNTSAAITDLQKASQLCLDLGRTDCYEDAQYQLSRLQATSTPQVPEESTELE
ncbi:tetratricopeptide repeat-containing serine/threonine-protein kinase [Oscillatoria sp. CS-180]|uniref:protein kinase family protein n=1 Tax=Oscillatoria sp. CS-180 TaxID=3021720 RepID=UPI00232B3585|nr:protein kinase family protein [Oscillatoria sp. CS-180]MDB9526733.1 tetratricopeptide repeat-containing serine/threonine-protein kinase [Oscillatoria sp. CS-180]